MENIKRMREDFDKAISKQLTQHKGKKIKVICGPYGIGKTRKIMNMADAAKFPAIMGFYTRDLRDKTYQWLAANIPNKKAIILHSPLEILEDKYDFDTKEFSNVCLNDDIYYDKALKEYLDIKCMGDENKVNKILKTYKQAQNKFKQELNRFFSGGYDIAFLTQQGLMLRILNSDKFKIPRDINVVFDELEVGLWTEDENNPQFNSRAQRMLKAGGKWTILTGDTRPALFQMPSEFRVINKIEKQFISPIAVMTHIPLGLGNSIKRPTRGRKGVFQRYEKLKDEKNHHNRKIALPLIVAEEKAKAKRDRKELLVVGNVGKDMFKNLGIHSFESMKGDNTIWESKKDFRIVIIGTCPPPQVLQQNSALFGDMFMTEFPISPKISDPDYKFQSEWFSKRKAHADKLLEADLLDKISQVIARVRGFRDRSDCDVIIYLWDRVDRMIKNGKFPYVWFDDVDNNKSLVRDIYMKRKIQEQDFKLIYPTLKKLKLRKKLIKQNVKHSSTQSQFRRNLDSVCGLIAKKNKKLNGYKIGLEKPDENEMNPDNI